MSKEIGTLHDWELYYERMYRKTGKEKYNIKRMEISKKIDEMTGMEERMKFREDVTNKIGESLVKNAVETIERLHEKNNKLKLNQNILDVPDTVILTSPEVQKQFIEELEKDEQKK